MFLGSEKLFMDFQLYRGSAPLIPMLFKGQTPNPCIVQGSAVSVQYLRGWYGIREKSEQGKVNWGAGEFGVRNRVFRVGRNDCLCR